MMFCFVLGQQDGVRGSKAVRRKGANLFPYIFRLSPFVSLAMSSDLKGLPFASSRRSVFWSLVSLHLVPFLATAFGSFPGVE